MKGSCNAMAMVTSSDAETLYTRGNSLMVQGRFAAAQTCYEQALQLRPDHAETHNNLAVAFAEQGQRAEAIPRYEQALRLKSNYPEAHFNLGNALKAERRFAEAAASYQRALQLRPDWPEARMALGLALSAQGKLDEAVACHHQALTLRPNYAEAHNNLALVLQTQGKLDEVLAHFDQSVQLAPNFAAAHANRAQVWMLLGHYRRGWPEYEWRWQLPGMHLPPLQRPLWDGAPLAGRTILLWTEQGVGDTLQFIRYAALVQKMGARVLLAAPSSLLPLLRSCPGIDQLLPREEPLPEFDVHAPLPSLPGIFGISLATVPAPIPYLQADPGLIQHWRREIGSAETFKIGIAWQGSPSYPGDLHRSIPLRHFAPLAQVPSIRLFSLQKGLGTEQLSEVNGRFDVVDWSDRLDETTGAFMDTAAVMHCLDLVITSDTATAHLAGALGLRAWVALPLSPDWRWLLDRTDSPWYPSLRLFRQTQLDNWDEVFTRMVELLRQQIG